MATYITLLRWTSKGLENIKESPARLDAARKVLITRIASKCGGSRMRNFWIVRNPLGPSQRNFWP
jgi:uncharacterized protein with GYD domain